MRSPVSLLLFSFLFVAASLPAAGRERKVTLLHFSDYHSHAVARAGETGGIARAIGYLSQQKRTGALVFSGGDMINKGAPAWSDKYGCAEWPWFNGIVDAMAFGNHEVDYGMPAFEACRARLSYPILSANTEGFRPWSVHESQGLRVGVFAVAGRDFPLLVNEPSLRYSDPVAAAREAVRVLREEQKVDVVAMIGHEHALDDYSLARSVPGIDVIFGTHSHLERELELIAGTATYFISPAQHLQYISRVTIAVDGQNMKRVTGGLVRVDRKLPLDRRISRRVNAMQQALQKDPRYSGLFVRIGRLSDPLSTEAIAVMTLAAMREAAAADVALSTTSSFRRPLPAGPLTMERLLDAMPYDNELVTCTMPGATLRQLMDVVSARKGSDTEAFVSMDGVVDPTRSYRVATTDYFANIAYRDAFDCERTRTGIKVREELRQKLTR